MADRITRRRFFTDVLFVGGGLLAASLLAAGVAGKPSEAATPTPTPTPQRPLPGDRVDPPPRRPYELGGKPMPPPPSPSPK